MSGGQRIVSLISSATEMLFALGLGEQVVGISHECDWPAAVSHLPRVTRSLVDATASSAAIDAQVQATIALGGPLYEVDVDELARLSPDLIVTQAQCDVCAVRYEDVLEAVRREPALRDASVLALNPTSLDDVLGDIRRLGAAAGAARPAQRCIAELTQRIDRIRRHTTSLPPNQRPRVAMIEWTEPLMIAGNWVPELVALAGGRCDLSTPGEHSGYTSWDELLQFAPELVVVAPCGFDLNRALVEVDALGRHPHWSRLPAVAADRVFAVDGNAYFNRSGPRLVDSLEILAHLAHPPTFPAPTWSAGDGARRVFRRC